MKLNIAGGILDGSGYASHTRQLANALYEQGISIHLETHVPPERITELNTAEYNMVTTPFMPEAPTLCINLPHAWRNIIYSGVKNFIGFLVWEGDAIPSFWLEHISDPHIRQIWVPSLHTKNAIETTIKRRELKLEDFPPIKIVPHGVDLVTFKPDANKRPEKDSFRFVANKGFARGLDDRGGIQWLLKAYLEEFKSDEPVELFVKINPSYCGPGWDFHKELEKLKIKNKERPKLKVNFSMIPFKEIPKLYHAGDVFVSPTMGEGFNLPGLEAMACGVPTIQTGFGGQVDYMTEHNSWYIDFDLIQAPNDIMYEEVKWAMPDIKHLRKLLRYVFNNPGEVKKKGIQSIEDSAHWKWSNSAKKALEHLKELDCFNLSE